MRHTISRQIELFNEKHGLDTDAQLRALAKEVGELNEAVNEDKSDAQIALESIDVAFVALSVAEMYSDDSLSMLRDTVSENLDKDSSKRGNKVTKE